MEKIKLNNYYNNHHSSKINNTYQSSKTKISLIPSTTSTLLLPLSLTSSSATTTTDEVVDDDDYLSMHDLSQLCNRLNIDNFIILFSHHNKYNNHYDFYKTTMQSAFITTLKNIGNQMVINIPLFFTFNYINDIKSSSSSSSSSNDNNNNIIRNNNTYSSLNAINSFGKNHMHTTTISPTNSKYNRDNTHSRSSQNSFEFIGYQQLCNRSSSSSGRSSATSRSSRSSKHIQWIRYEISFYKHSVIDHNHKLYYFDGIRLLFQYKMNMLRRSNSKIQQFLLDYYFDHRNNETSASTKKNDIHTTNSNVIAVRGISSSSSSSSIEEKLYVSSDMFSCSSQFCYTYDHSQLSSFINHQNHHCHHKNSYNNDRTKSSYNYYNELQNILSQFHNNNNNNNNIDNQRNNKNINKTNNDDNHAKNIIRNSIKLKDISFIHNFESQSHQNIIDNPNYTTFNTMKLNPCNWIVNIQFAFHDYRRYMKMNSKTATIRSSSNRLSSSSNSGSKDSNRSNNRIIENHRLDNNRVDDKIDVDFNDNNDDKIVESSLEEKNTCVVSFTIRKLLAFHLFTTIFKHDFPRYTVTENNK